MHIEGFLVLAAVGAFAGFMAGLLGIGGGLLMVPFISYYLAQQGVGPQLGVKMAIATAMATIVVTSISSVRAHHRLGKVRWPVAASLVPGVGLGSVVASVWIFSNIKGGTLAVVFALFVGFLATQMYFDRKPQPARQLPGAMGLGAVGSAIGLVSGLVGAGGAFITVPFLTWCNMPIHQAVATSSALGFPIAFFNAVGYIYSGWGIQGLPSGSLGYVWVPACLAMTSCSMLTAPMGARAAQKLPVQKLKRIFGTMLIFIAAYMLNTGLQQW
ncbi:MAG: sulfite exporter TauE/SafE family protein [Alphaproteobacteria bacterium]|nr:sulfite exporter TauE/SafE family protein [Alphaproteobacteria bacterium]